KWPLQERSHALRWCLPHVLVLHLSLYARDVEYLLLVQGLPLHEGGSQAVQAVTVLRQQGERLVVALLDDPAGGCVDGLCGRFAVRLVDWRPDVTTQELPALLGERDRTYGLAHAPLGDHVVRQARHLPKIVLRARGAVTVDQLLGRPATQRPHDAPAEVTFRVVVAVVLGLLIGHAQRLPARRDGDARDGVGSRHDETEDGVAGLVVRDALAVLALQEQFALRPQ